MLDVSNDLVAIEVSGVDSQNYLQGQLTNDIKLLEINKYQLSAHLNNKGRTLATFIIYCQEENKYLLFTSKQVATKVLPRLKMFVLRSKVKLELLDKSVVLHDEVGLVKIGDKYLDIVADIDGEISDGSNQLHELFVENTIPMIYLENYEKIIPQQFNFDLLGGVNFKKGCYTGQEIVARMHYLGKVKRRLYKLTSKEKIVIGDEITSPKMNNQIVGDVIDVYQKDNKFIALGSLQINCCDDVEINSNAIVAKALADYQL